MDLLKREAETSGLKMYGDDGGGLPLPQASAEAAATTSGAVDDAPTAEYSDSDSDADSIIGDAESSAERDES